MSSFFSNTVLVLLSVKVGGVLDARFDRDFFFHVTVAFLTISRELYSGFSFTILPKLFDFHKKEKKTLSKVTLDI